MLLLFFDKKGDLRSPKRPRVEQRSLLVDQTQLKSPLREHLQTVCSPVKSKLLPLQSSLARLLIISYLLMYMVLHTTLSSSANNFYVEHLPDIRGVIRIDMAELIVTVWYSVGLFLVVSIH